MARALDAEARARGLHGRPVALEARRPEARGDRVGRVEQQGVRAGAMAVGHDRDGRRRPAPPRSAATSAGSSSGVSPGTSSTRPNPAAIACRIPISVAGDCPARSVSSRTSAPRRQRHLAGTRVGGDHRRRRRGRAPGRERRARRPPSPRRATGGRGAEAPGRAAASRRRNVLTGRIARVFIGPAKGEDSLGAQPAEPAAPHSVVPAGRSRPRASSSTLAGHPPPVRGGVHQRVDRQRRQAASPPRRPRSRPAGRRSAPTIPAALASMPGLCAEGLRRALDRMRPPRTG